MHIVYRFFFHICIHIDVKDGTNQTKEGYRGQKPVNKLLVRYVFTLMSKMVQIKPKRGTGVKNPSTSFWCGMYSHWCQIDRAKSVGSHPADNHLSCVSCVIPADYTRDTRQGLHTTHTRHKTGITHETVCNPGITHKTGITHETQDTLQITHETQDRWLSAGCDP